MNAGYIIASTAIWAIGATRVQALADYVRQTGDEVTLDTLSTNPREGTLFIMPATQDLLDHVAAHGGATSWDDTGDVADIIRKEEA
jgi:hypothetical protein